MATRRTFAKLSKSQQRRLTKSGTTPATYDYAHLTPAYKKRLASHGITPANYRQLDQNVARGHRSTRVVGAIDEGVLRRVVSGQGTVGEVTGGDLLSRFTWPSWVPATVSNQQDGFTYAVDPVVAAALSRLPDPRTWARFHFEPAPNDEPWLMVVEVKRRKKPVTTLIPGGGGAGTGAKVVMDIVTSLETAENVRRMKSRAELLFFLVRETDEVA
jgi:hypothetical protein